jgi:mono/diheme cytochrome c family protein
VTETVGSPRKGTPPAPETAPTAAPTPTPTSAPAPAPSSNASLVSTGQSIFKGQCVACHGADASGNTAIGKKNNIPDFRSNTVQGRSDADLANVLTNGIGPISSSAHKSKHLSSDQEKAVIAYIRSLK